MTPTNINEILYGRNDIGWYAMYHLPFSDTLYLTKNGKWQTLGGPENIYFPTVNHLGEAVQKWEDTLTPTTTNKEGENLVENTLDDRLSTILDFLERERQQLLAENAQLKKELHDAIESKKCISHYFDLVLVEVLLS